MIIIIIINFLLLREKSKKKAQAEAKIFLPVKIVKWCTHSVKIVIIVTQTYISLRTHNKNTQKQTYIIKKVRKNEFEKVT